MEPGRVQPRQMTFGCALRGGAGIFERCWPALLGTYFVGLLLQVAVVTAGVATVAYMLGASAGISGVVVVGLLTAFALVAIVGTEYLIVCRLALDAHDGTPRTYGEVVSCSVGRLGAFVLRIVVLSLFLTVLRLAAALVLFPLMGLSAGAGVVIAILSVILGVVVFVLALAFLPFAVLERLREPLRSSIAISFERAFTVMPVLLCMAGGLLLVAFLSAGAERSGMGPAGQILAVGLQGMVYVFGYCVLAVVFRSSSLGEVTARPALAIPPVPGALERFSITPGAPARAGVATPPQVAPSASPPPKPAWQQVQVTHPVWGPPRGGGGGTGGGASLDPWGWARNETPPRTEPPADPPG